MDLRFEYTFFLKKIEMSAMEAFPLCFVKNEPLVQEPLGILNQSPTKTKTKQKNPPKTTATPPMGPAGFVSRDLEHERRDGGSDDTAVQKVGPEKHKAVEQRRQKHPLLDDGRRQRVRRLVHGEPVREAAQHSAEKVPNLLDDRTKHY
jgi:hypothetical protein